jgi:site-specific DNA recombinase
MRYLGAVRLSLVTDETTSPARQRELIEHQAHAPGNTLVAIAQDLDVSGAVSPFNRPDLGPWLSDETKVIQWDVLCIAKLDRLSRSLIDFANLLRWCEDNGKTIVSVSESLDFGTATGRLLANLLMLFAEFEREQIRERRKAAAKYLRETGQYGGGRVPFGYVPERQGARGYRLVQDAGLAPIAQRMVAEALAGVSLRKIARRLDADGIPTSLNAQRGRSVKEPRPGEEPKKPSSWHNNTIRAILTSPVLVGQTAEKRNGTFTVVRDKRGQPVMFTDEPIITEDEWLRLQRVLRARTRAPAAAQARHLLWRVAYCANCSAAFGKSSPHETDVILYGHRRLRQPEKPGYYVCKRCGFSIRLLRLNEAVEALVLQEAGPRMLREKRVVPGDDHAVEIARLERRAENLREVLSQEHDEGLAAVISNLETKITDLGAQPHEPTLIEWVPVASGTTVAEHWAGLDTTQRNGWLREWGVVAYVDATRMRTRLGWLSQDDNLFRLPGGRLS